MLLIIGLILVILIYFMMYKGNNYEGRSERDIFDVTQYAEYPYVHLIYNTDFLVREFNELRGDDSYLEHSAPEEDEGLLFGKTLELSDERQKDMVTRLYISGKRYEPLVDYFQEEVRVRCHRENMESPYDLFHNPRISTKWWSLNTKLALRKHKQKKERVSNITYTMMRNDMEDAGLKECDLMSANVVSQLVKDFGAKRILMPTGGWGDAILGAMSRDPDRLVAVDPNAAAVENWEKMKELYVPELGEDRLDRYEFIISPFEEVPKERLLEGGTFDFIYSCPPYFVAEKYTECPGQSWVEHPELDDWFDNFLIASFSKAWECLDVGGYMVLIINDIWHNGKKVHYVQRLHDYIDQHFEGSTYIETRGFKKKAKQTVYQPIFIWQKNKV